LFDVQGSVTDRDFTKPLMCIACENNSQCLFKRVINLHIFLIEKSRQKSLTRFEQSELNLTQTVHPNLYTIK